MAAPGPKGRANRRKVFAGRYAYVRPLGRGAGGAVYLAEDLRENNRLAALKVLSPEAVATVQGKMLRREFEILSKLDHPNLVRVYDYGALPDGGVFLAEEYIDGFSLQDARALLEPAALVDTTLQLLQGLSYVHGMGMIHRDIKPANVMLLWLDDANAARPMVKLVDFGLSSADPKKDTLRGGTRSYMAPEIIRGEKGEFRSDLYSLGVTLYYAMCGVLPFGPRSKEDPPTSEEDFRPPDPHRLNPDVPLELSRFTMVLLRLVPSIEFADAGEALQALADDSASLEWVATGQLANSLDIAAPPVLRGYFERGILVRQDAQRDALVEDLGPGRPNGTMHLVRGPHGVGKSRLLREVAASMKLGSRLVVEQQCYEGMQPFGLLTELLKQIIEIAEGRKVDVGDRIKPSVHIMERLAPWKKHAKDAAARASEHAWIREAFHDLVVLLSADRVVVFIEDLHLADEDSVALLASWFADKEGTHRPDMVVSASSGAAADQLSTLRDVEVLEAEGLRAEDVSYFFKERLGEDRLGDDWVQQVTTASRGNPAYVEELSRHLIDSGILSRKSSISWEIRLDELMQFSLPRGVEESLRRRLGKLGNLGREALELMALLGRPVEWSTLRKLLVAGGESAEDADRTMELLRWRHFVFLELDARGRHLRLIDSALGRVVLGQMNAEWRRSVHRRIGERLRKNWFAGSATAHEAATHLDLGGSDEDACVMREIAGDDFARDSDFTRAAASYEAALRLGARGPASVIVRVKLAETYVKIHETDAAVECLREAWESAERLESEWLRYRVCLAGFEVMLTLGKPEQAREWLDKIQDFLPRLAAEGDVQAAEARILAARGQIEAAKDRLLECLARVQKFGNRDGVVRALALMGRLEMWGGRPEHAKGYFADAVEIGEANEGWEPLGVALCGQGELQRYEGEFVAALATLQNAFEIASAHGNVDLWIEVLLEIAETHTETGEYDSAHQRATEALEFAQDLGHELWTHRARFVIGEVGLRRRTSGAIEVMENALNDLAASPYSFPFGVSAMARLGRAYARAGRSEDSAAMLRRTKRLAAEFGLETVKLRSVD